MAIIEKRLAVAQSLSGLGASALIALLALDAAEVIGGGKLLGCAAAAIALLGLSVGALARALRRMDRRPAEGRWFFTTASLSAMIVSPCP